MVYTHIHNIHKNENDQTIKNISVAHENQSHHCWSHTDKQAPGNNDTYKIKLELVMSEIITQHFTVIKFLNNFKFLLSEIN